MCLYSSLYILVQKPAQNFDFFFFALSVLYRINALLCTLYFIIEKIHVISCIKEFVLSDFAKITDAIFDCFCQF